MTDTETNLIVGTRVSEQFSTYYWFLHEVIVTMLHLTTLTTEITSILCFKQITNLCFKVFSFFVSVKKIIFNDSHVAETRIHNIASLLCLKKLLGMTILKGHKTKLALMLTYEMKLKSPYPDDHCLTASTCNVSLLLISFFAARERITSMEFLIWSSLANT